jgi:predicted  nucleic acid-binding Zn-ribbon protein
MEQDTILLKIKREFTTDEAVQTVLKAMAELQKEIGMLKSELAEAEDKVEKIRTEKTFTRRQWMEQEMFEQLHKENTFFAAKSKEYKRDMEEWQAKYFGLLIQQRQAC